MGVDYDRFYKQLYAPLEANLGSIDPDTIFAIIGFDCGGPLNFCTWGAKEGGQVVTYVSCELAVRSEQQPSASGRYEFLCSCDSEEWVRSIVSGLGRMSLQTIFGHGHTIDIGGYVDPNAAIQAVLLQEEYSLDIAGSRYAILRVIGITRAELQHVLEHGSEALIVALSAHDVYPNTLIGRPSAI